MANRDTNSELSSLIADDLAKLVARAVRHKVESAPPASIGHLKQRPIGNGPLRSFDIGYFDPPSSSPDQTDFDVSVLYANATSPIYTDVLAFCRRLQYVAAHRSAKEVVKVWPRCLKGAANCWYSKELSPLDRRELSIGPIANITSALVKRFKVAPMASAIGLELKCISSPLCDNAIAKDIVSFAQHLIQTAKACNPGDQANLSAPVVSSTSCQSQEAPVSIAINDNSNALRSNTLHTISSQGRKRALVNVEDEEGHNAATKKKPKTGRANAGSATATRLGSVLTSSIPEQISRSGLFRPRHLTGMISEPLTSQEIAGLAEHLAHDDEFVRKLAQCVAKSDGFIGKLTDAIVNDKVCIEFVAKEMARLHR